MIKAIFSKDHKYTVEQLRKARLEAGLDQADVAKLLGKTHRKSDTGIGKTLEDLLGIKENNIASPNFRVILY